MITYCPNANTWNQKRIDTTMKCTKDCQKRTVTCKFDGTCDKWENYQASKVERKEQYHHKTSNKRNLMKGLSGGRIT